jgi:hypothetical protein
MNGRLFEVADNYLIHDIKLRQYTITIIILVTFVKNIYYGKEN